MEEIKKVVILYSTAGMGHKKAAMALLKECEARCEKGVEIKAIDVMDYAVGIYRFLYLDFYVFLMRRAKWLWGGLYYFSNIGIVDYFTRGARGILDYCALPGLMDMLSSENPDAVVATHFFLPSIARILKKKKSFKAKTYTLITDYGPHAFWLSKYIDKFFSGSVCLTERLIKLGIPAGKIETTGIPVAGDFSEKVDKNVLKEAYGLDKNRKTIFLMSGGFGVGPIENILLLLNLCRAHIQVIAVAGHNKAVYENVLRLKEKLKYPVMSFGFTDKVAELMAMSDLFVTKAGGISVTEALNSRLPMILFASIPGQEAWNEEFLIKNNVARKAYKAEDVPRMADEIFFSEETYTSLKEGIDKIRRPDACRRIADIILGF